MTPFIGTYTNDEIGEIRISKDGDEYIAQIDAYQTRIMKYTDKGKKHSLVFMDPPLAGIRLFPHRYFSHSFTLYGVQERYRFKSSNPGVLFTMPFKL